MDKDEELTTKHNATNALITIGKLDFEVVVTHESECLAYPLNGPKVALPINGIGYSLSDRLMRKYMDHYGKVPSSRALEDATRVLMSDAFQLPKVQAFFRNARVGDDIYLDLGDESGRAVHFSKGSWSVIERPPVYFRRTELTGVLRTPIHGGSIEQLFSILNIPERIQPLVVGYLIAGLDPEIPMPIFNIGGEQGSGKSTLGKRMRAIIDPSPLQSHSAPTDEGGWSDIAGSARLIAFDNLSSISTKFSDILCKAVTGDSSGKRRLYSDRGLVVRKFMPIIMLNGISVSITRDDLADRILSVNLPVITSIERKDAKGIESEWDEQLPAILGALYTIAAKVYTALPGLRLAELPRMADFARVLAATDEVRATNSLGIYLEDIGSIASSVVELDAFLQAVIKEVKAPWTGTSSELLGRTEGSRHYLSADDWPTTPRHVTERLSRKAPTLRKLGWEVVDLGSNNQEGTKRWKLSPPS